VAAGEELMRFFISQPNDNPGTVVAEKESDYSLLYYREENQGLLFL
jgi:hypothetical protein